MWWTILVEIDSWIIANSVYLSGFFVGIASGLVANAFVVWIQRPHIEITEDCDKPAPAYLPTYFHVIVKNSKVQLLDRFFQRAMAVDCESRVSFADKISGKFFPNSPFKTKWLRQNIGDPNSLTRLNLYVGQRDGDKAGVQLDIVERLGRSQSLPFCWIQDPERQKVADPLGKWQLPLGSYFVMVQIQYAGGKSKPKFFTLENDVAPEKTSLVLCSDEKTAKRIFRRLIL